MKRATVGIIANPESGRDIRRLVAHASVFDNMEKVSIVERLLILIWELMMVVVGILEILWIILGAKRGLHLGFSCLGF